jgi:hypothetical protein
MFKKVLRLVATIAKSKPPTTGAGIQKCLNSLTFLTMIPPSAKSSIAKKIVIV